MGKELLQGQGASDFVSEVLAEQEREGQGGPEGAPGMPTPADIIAAESGTAPAAPAAEPSTGTQPPGAPAAAPTGDDVNPEEVERKILAGEELTEKEAAFLSEIDKRTESLTPPPPKNYVINGQSLTFDEAAALFREETGLGNIRINANGFEKLVDQFVNDKNRGVAQARISQGQRENAAERSRLAEERVRLSTERKNLQRQRELLTNQRQQVNALLQTQLTKEDLYDTEGGQLDPEKLAHYSRQAQAREQLPFLEQQAQQIEDEISTTNKALLTNDIATLMEVAPQYRMSEDFTTIATKMAQAIPVDRLDVIKMREIYRFIEDRKAFGGTLEDAYAYAKEAGTLAVKPGAAHAAPGTMPGSPVRPTLPNIPSTQQMLADKVKAFREKQRKANASVGGGGGGDRGITADKSPARALVEAGRKVTGHNADPFVANELGFGSKS